MKIYPHVNPMNPLHSIGFLQRNLKEFNSVSLINTELILLVQLSLHTKSVTIKG